ncbi:PQ-loop domain-containing transporter [Priestia megaterium]|jgi:MtN3 and saliva related transmembrane protein|uniref:PQ-loop domain-containing transporter n=1 Tax=Priestia megaterium TaxID=1404 RepID=UPI00203C1412|nr:PQ-loop domain-containing transporter [Priestia megaterium]MCM3155570.1 PQ-loop domain-containing transporter [Priestia megaterium]
MTALSFFNMLQLIGGLILAVGYIPQIVKIIKTGSVRDFSKIYIGGIFTGIVFMEAYAIYMYFVQGAAGAFFATNTVSFILSGTEFFLVLYFWNKTPKKKLK